MAHTVKTILQLYQSITDQAVSLVNSKNSHLVEVSGQLGDIKDDTKYPILYGLKLKDGADYILLDVSRSLIKQKNLFGGQFVKVTGRLKGNYNEYTDYRLEIRIEASDIVGITSPDEIENQRKAQENIAALLKLNAGRHAFPLKESISITLITGRVNKVEMDFLHSVSEIREFIQINTVYVNITDRREIIEAIQNAKSDILCIIRGGGTENQIEVFNDPMILSAIAKWPGYRIVGIGHSVDANLCDLISDFSAETPGHAGGEIYKKYIAIAQLLKRASESQKEAEQLRYQVATLRTDEKRSIVTPKKSKLINLIITFVLISIIFVILREIIAHRF